MLNFKKAGIFSRGTGQEDAYEQEEQGGRADIAHAEHPQRPGPAVRLYQHIVQHGA